MSGRRESIVAMWSLGYEMAEIAGMIGITRQAVHLHLKAHGYTHRDRSVKPVSAELPHGVSGWEQGCRCGRCSDARAEYIRRIAPRSLPWSTPADLRSYFADGMCPFCGGGPFEGLGMHLGKSSECPSAEEAKSMADMPRSASLLSLDLITRLSRQAVDRGAGAKRGEGQGEGRSVSQWRGVSLRTSGRKDGEAHGTPVGYDNGCRCVDCRAAQASRAAVQRGKRRLALESGAAAEIKHGTVGAYGNWGCRCDECYEAHSRAVRQANKSRKLSWRAVSNEAQISRPA